jgi:hypothetical protein
MVWLLTPCFLATSGTDFSSASRRIVTICSSVNRVFFMRSSGVEGAILSGFSWSEKPQAGHRHFDGAVVFDRLRLCSGNPDRSLDASVRSRVQKWCEATGVQIPDLKVKVA